MPLLQLPKAHQIRMLTIEENDRHESLAGRASSRHQVIAASLYTDHRIADHRQDQIVRDAGEETAVGLSRSAKAHTITAS